MLEEMLTSIQLVCKISQPTADCLNLEVDPRVARWDMRVPGGVVQQNLQDAVMTYQSGKAYSSKPNFTCMATTGKP